MPLKSRQTPGLNHVPEYQVSGHTYVLARGNTTRAITLNYIPNEVTIINESATHPLEVEFEDSTKPTSVKRSAHLPKGSHKFRIKCKKIKFVVVDASQQHSAVIACTGIPVDDYNPIIYDVLGEDTP
tara:strand:- start:178 stop:558 length:381 start_codon:yes stop_codon:yes gene_type:complete